MTKLLTYIYTIHVVVVAICVLLWFWWLTRSAIGFIYTLTFAASV
jgi:hypothetical protein